MKDQESDEIRKQYKKILDRRFQTWNEKGSNLSDTMQDFLREVAERDWVRSQDERGARMFARAMSDRQRQLKGEIRRKLRAGLADLAALTSFIAAPHAPKVQGIGPRFTASDIEGILDLPDLLQIVRFGVETFEESYADSLLDVIAGFYKRRRRSVMVYQTFGGGPLG